MFSTPKSVFAGLYLLFIWYFSVGVIRYMPQQQLMEGVNLILKKVKKHTYLDHYFGLKIGNIPICDI